MLRQALICILFIVCAPQSAISQGFPGGGGFGTSSTVSSDSTRTKFFTIFKGNPGRATLYSLIIPGAGQLYNGRWWKVPLVYGMEGFAIWYYIDNRKLYNRWNNCYLSILSADVNTEFCGERITQQSNAFDLRNRARSLKERAFLIMIGAHLFQTLEAFIDRHLIDFDVDENLSHTPSHYSTPHSSFESQIPVFSIKIPLDRRTAR